MTATFRAMTTEVAIQAPTLGLALEADLARAAAALFEASERAFSRFRPDSELSRLNRSPGPAAVSPALFGLLSRARAYAEQTDGAFDPAVGGALIAAGYGSSFAPGALDRDREAGDPPPRASILDVKFHEETHSVDRPPGALLDLGGLAKGFTVDRAASLLPATAAIDAGGDAALRGLGPDGEGWVVEVESPFDPAETVLSIMATDRSVATSSASRRSWRRGASRQHHLIDPRTGRPARTDLAQVTALAPSTEVAEVLAKAAFVLGSREGARLLGRFAGAGGVLVLASGVVKVVGEVEVLP